MAYELCLFWGDEVRRVRLATPGEYVIGRADGSEVRIDHPSVSRKHALLTLGERLVIRDLGSANGTVLRGRKALARADETENVERLMDEEAEIAVGDPVSVGVVTVVVRRAEDDVREAGSPDGRASGFLIVAPEMRALYEQASRAAASPISVLILGETGVGKEVLAKAIHARSPRASGSFLSLNCGALAESIIEGELFGYEKGAFTGAVQARPGVFEAASGGTVFLDEVGELPPTTQAKLLRVLEDRTVMRLGARQPHPIDVRFVSATNRDLEALATTGGFRQDLYFRLNGISFMIPPLRERKSEIEPLARQFVAAACRAMERGGLELGAEALGRLLQYGTRPPSTALKERFVALPAGTRIDTRDMNHWQFPVGTRFWKEFTIDGRRVETRMIERHGDSPDDYLFASFVWNEAGDDATLAAGGEEGVLGTSHRIPTEVDCQTCHHGEPGRVLGFSALQLGAIVDDGDGLTLGRLVAEGRVTDPPPVAAHYGIPGDDVERPALGYLHANCGHCHNPTGSCDFAEMLLRLDVDEHVPEKSGVYRSIVGEPLAYDDGLTRSTIRVAPGAPEKSAIVERMSVRGPNTAAMPWLATNDVDEAGVARVTAWILSLGG